MTEKRSVRDEEWAKNAPDYMVAAIELLVETRDDARQLLQSLNERESLLRDKESAFMQAAADMKHFAGQLYGPDSELSKINLRLEGLPHVDEVTRRLDEHGKRLDGHDGSIADLHSRVTSLEQLKTA